MRRKDKYILVGTAVFFTATSIVDIILQWRENKQVNKPFNWENYDGWRTLKRSAIAGLVGGGVGYGVYRYKLSEEAKLPFHSDSYLKKLLAQENLKANPGAFRNIKRIKDKIRNILWNEFQHDLVAFPEDAGSFFKQTALKSKYDLDIILPFKKNSYASLMQMYYDVYEAIGSKLGHQATVSKQTKAIGLTLEYYGELVHFDIVPGREINDYMNDRDLNLYVRPNWVWQRGSQFKTNVGLQKKITVNSPKARETIKLLKKYKDANALNLPTIIIEQYTVDALSSKNYGVYSSPTENLLNSMDFISRKIVQNTLLDIANSNNNLHQKVDYYERKDIASLMCSDIEKIENNPAYIKEVFN